MVSLVIFLLVLGFALIVGEFFTGSHVLLALGIVSVYTAVAFWAAAGLYGTPVELWSALLIVVIIAVPVGFAISRIRKTFKRQVTTGKEDLRGKTAVVERALDPEGTVLYQGELWTAISSSGKIRPGEQVTIKEVQGLTLLVEKKG